MVSSDGITYDVTAESCRRGARYISQGLKARGVADTQAGHVIATIISEKTAKGYKVISDCKTPPASRHGASVSAPAPAPKPSPAFAGVPAAHGPVAPRVKAKPELRPITATTITADALSLLLGDANIAMHSTLGGTPLVVGVDAGNPLGVDSDGYAAVLPPSLTAALASVGGDFTLVGELLDGVFHAWDILKVDGRDVRGLSFVDRRFELTYLLCGRTVDASILKPVFVEDSADKAPFYFMLQDEGAKAVVFWSLSAEGGTPEGKPLVFRFSSEVQACVCGVVGNGRRIEVALHPVTNAHPGYSQLPVEWRGLPVEMTISIGFVDLPDGQARPKIGSVVKISYETIQPMKGGNQGLRFVGVVADGKDEDCHIGQIRFQA